MSDKLREENERLRADLDHAERVLVAWSGAIEEYEYRYERPDPDVLGYLRDLKVRRAIKEEP